jgi:hypothetical protein
VWDGRQLRFFAESAPYCDASRHRSRGRSQRCVGRAEPAPGMATTLYNLISYVWGPPRVLRKAAS